ncbi:MAG TPA: hypothetical protein VEZ89_12075, partial [Rubrivivax sp.]|nr:hypothetical protein [Rubrivivax sp.]
MFVVCTLWVLSACGGGGGAEPAPAPSTATAGAALAFPAPAASAQAVARDGSENTAAAATDVLNVPTALAGNVNAPMLGAAATLPIGAATTGVDMTTTTAGTDSLLALADAEAVALGDLTPATSMGGGVAVAGAAAATAPPRTPSYQRAVHVSAAAGSGGDGSAASPYSTISAAMNQLRAGDDVVIGAGTYREWVVVPQLAANAPATRIRAAAARTVTIKGSREVGGWDLVSPGVYAV